MDNYVGASSRPTDGCADRIEVIHVIIFDGLVVHVALLGAGCIKCRFTEGSTTRLGGLTVYIEK